MSSPRSSIGWDSICPTSHLSESTSTRRCSGSPTSTAIRCLAPRSSSVSVSQPSV
ncbi:MAG: hypothetical protein ACK55Z_28715 [bacterium]